MVRLDFQRPAITCLGALKLFEFLQGNAFVEIDFGIVGLDLPRTAVAGCGFIEPPEAFRAAPRFMYASA
ncbi:MAG: hypothetical protein M5R42_21790 [Rhodocyclaceae bacterium]|nr:hypothetical protein [Rhodocyclaceae bacterium]